MTRRASVKTLVSGNSSAKMLKTSFVVLTLAAVISARTSEKLKVALPDGSRLVGRYLTTDSGKGMRAWMGVPYAEAPVGELRFKVRR